MLLYNPQDKLERYNAPDTLKCQHSFKLTQGSLPVLRYGFGYSVRLLRTRWGGMTPWVAISGKRPEREIYG